MPGSPHSGMSSAGGSGVAGIQMLKTHSDKIDPTASAATPVTITYWYDPTQEEIFMTRANSGAVPAGPAVLMSRVRAGSADLHASTICRPQSSGKPFLPAATLCRRAVSHESRWPTSDTQTPASSPTPARISVSSSRIPPSPAAISPDFEIPPPGPGPWSIAFLLRFTLSVALAILIAIRCWPPRRFCGESSGAP